MGDQVSVLTLTMADATTFMTVTFADPTAMPSGPDPSSPTQSSDSDPLLSSDSSETTSTPQATTSTQPSSTLTPTSLSSSSASSITSSTPPSSSPTIASSSTSSGSPSSTIVAVVPTVTTIAPHSNKLSPSAIGGITVGAAFAIGFLVFLLLLLYQRRQARPTRTLPSYNKDTSGNDPAQRSTEPLVPDPPIQPSSSSMIESHPEQYGPQVAMEPPYLHPVVPARSPLRQERISPPLPPLKTDEQSLRNSNPYYEALMIRGIARSSSKRISPTSHQSPRGRRTSPVSAMSRRGTQDTMHLDGVYEGLEDQLERPVRFRRSVYDSLAWIHFNDSQESLAKRR
ncbi:hypothetical protein K461DRAFT_281760 [Myriangium duriaei CBS 260.36]|uniref:Uncharacterized protein n=1 Tax=Myriangium duriaei CBS 260.36 TaxID=1168546 RepID=A0A9P4IVS5_9PEZI|nr:hypothetical protein K461DRAFT_281760 [Myriangium duriaei CBS 260.36]